MSFVKINENGYLTDKNGQPFYLVGINFAPRYVKGVFWKENWNPESIISDLDKMKSMGLNGIRFPVHWYAFEPEEGKIDPLMMERLDWFMGLCREREIYMHPWFLVGCGCGMFDIPWRKGRSVMFDESMILAEEKHIATFAKRYKDDEYIIAWDICDEPEWWSIVTGGEDVAVPFDRQKFAAWTRRMYHAFKDNDPNHMVTMGIGHIATGEYGMDLRDMNEILDILTITAYNGNNGEGIDRARPGFFYDWNADMNRFGKTVYLCEAPGQSSGGGNFDEEIAGQYESAIFGSWLHGSAGAMPWALQCYPEEVWVEGYLDQYSNEQEFSVVRPDGSLKPQGQTLCQIAEVMKKINAPQYPLRKPEAALLIPDGYHVHAYECYPKLNEAYSALLASDVPLETVWITDNYEKYPYLVVANTRSAMRVSDFKASDTLRLYEYVKNGGKLLYFWHPGQGFGPFFERTFGAVAGTVARLWEPDKLTFTTDLGRFHTGDQLDLPAAANWHPRLKPTTAEVLATVDGWPCILHNRVGKGQVIYVALDILGGLYDLSPAKWENCPMVDLSGILMERLGLARPIICNDHNVECGFMRSTENDSCLAVLINRNDKPSTASAFIPGLQGYVPFDPDGNPMAYCQKDDGLEICPPFAARKATLVILKK